MSLARQAARGAALMIAASLGARIVGMAGTLIMTHYLAPHVVGEVSAATIVVQTANWLTVWGFGQYAIVRGQGDDLLEVTWHCTVAMFALGVVGLGVAAAFGGDLMGYFGAPLGAVFVPGMALAIGIRRIGSIPEKLLVRQMRFRPIALTTAAGELTYAVTSVLFAMRGWGGKAIVIGNVVQSTVMTAILIGAAGVREWTTPTRLRLARFIDMARFGLPLAVEAVAHNASRTWDNLLMGRYFKAGPMALYSLGYNLADLPAAYIGEQIAQVLLPSMSRLPPERRPRALERATALLCLIIFPLAIGLGLIASPLVEMLLAPEWQDVAPLLSILAALSVFRPVTWVLSTYLEAEARTSRLMFLEVAKVIVLLAGISVLARWGIHWAAVAVGIAFGFNAIAGVWLVVHDGPSPWRMVVAFVQPLAACAVMAVAVEGARLVLWTLGVDSPAARLIIEVLAGAGAYVAAALVICRGTARDLIGLARDALARRRPAAATA